MVQLCENDLMILNHSMFEGSLTHRKIHVPLATEHVIIWEARLLSGLEEVMSPVPESCRIVLGYVQGGGDDQSVPAEIIIIIIIIM